MVKLTREQRLALKRVFDRQPLIAVTRMHRDHLTTFAEGGDHVKPGDAVLTYHQFRKNMVHYGYDCIMVPWCGMWLGIERDGYTHS